MSSNDLDDRYINRYVGRVEDPNEMLMRADFDRLLDLREAAGQADTDEKAHGLSDEAHQVFRKWAHRGDDYGQAWNYLFDAKRAWSRSPETMHQFMNQVAVDRAGLTPMQERSLLHVRELTGNGEWNISSPEIGQDSTDRAPIPGHAFSGLVNDRDCGQEMER
ncbi:hypothetical protein OHB12_33725 [Nocardia sp. NBC_01730]|uniref:hypothetical protein n=1 Tax=Nocardia sp. NBC_01730 TaxID=2975998 RepID=UPI002E156693|nr:hypothetical protein OHB12_33725 [Nocardia sp. NBC_01730]